MLETISIYQHCKEVEEDNVILSFKGTISQEILKDVATNLRLKYRLMQYTAKKVFSVFIELAQNIYHHSADKEISIKIKRPAGVGILIVRDYKEHIVISSGNLVEKKIGEKIAKRCRHINQLEKTELRKYYKEQRRQPTAKNGGNIGLIDIARKSGHPLGFEVVPVSTDNSFFSISITIDKETVNN